MLKPQKKMTKHELKEDKFVKFSLQAKSYLDENYQKLSRYVLGAAGLVLIILFFYYNSQQNNAQANSQLGIAQIEFANGNLANSQERLVRLIEEYGSTNAAEQGMFLLANIYYQQKDFENARIYFEKFVDGYSGSNILLSSGYAGLAACEETSRNYSRAAELYEKAADMTPDFPESDNHYFMAGLCYKKAGELKKSKIIFADLAEDGKTDARKQQAETQLVLLGSASQ